MDKQTSLSHYNNMNIFSMHGLIGAYSKDGQEWADELKAVLTEIWNGHMILSRKLGWCRACKAGGHIYAVSGLS